MSAVDTLSLTCHNAKNLICYQVLVASLTPYYRILSLTHWHADTALAVLVLSLRAIVCLFWKKYSIDRQVEK